MRASVRRSVIVVLAGVSLLSSASGARRAAAQAPAHGGHGTPAGWTLSWPPGDPGRGRAAFLRFECHSCHEVRGERFPAPGDPATLGPELASMGPLHAPAYFVESIVNPSAVIERGHGYQAPDGSSRMPSYNDSMTVQELIDLVAYLRALRPPPARPAGSKAGDAGRHGPHH